jgi:hypothetical protein
MQVGDLDDFLEGSDEVPVSRHRFVSGIALAGCPADVPLDLQMLIDRCYHHGRYDDIDYRAAPPPLTPDEESWAHELLVRLGTHK